jgi:tungstate transport system ATP-binding protein
MIRARGLTLKVNPEFTLSVDSLDVAAGEVFAVIGPNGAGKTTLLNTLALLREAGSGSLELLGRNALLPENKLFLRRSMSVVFSQPYLINNSVYENVALPLKLRGLKDGAAVEKALELFKITHLKDRSARTLSQGESHRAALARAFVTSPKLVLLDEPFGSLDARVKETIARDLRRALKAAYPAAVLLVTQDQGEALTLCDKLAVMAGGRIAQQGAPQDLFARPATKEVADFTGVETILPGKVSAKDDNLCSIQAGGLTLEVISDCAAGDEVFVCVRPEDVSVSKSREAGSMRNHFSAKITSVEPWGLEYKVGLDCGFPLMAAVTRQSVDSLGLKPGLDVFASFKATAAHLIKR